MTTTWKGLHADMHAFAEKFPSPREAKQCAGRAITALRAKFLTPSDAVATAEGAVAAVKAVMSQDGMRVGPKSLQFLKSYLRYRQTQATADAPEASLEKVSPQLPENPVLARSPRLSDIMLMLAAYFEAKGN